MPADLAVAERRPGRPRDENCDRAIETAALDLLVADGFDKMSVEGVAARAGVGKATIYRRWATKADLIIDAVVHRCNEHIVEPDTGSVRDDVLAMTVGLLEKYRRDGDVMRAFAAERIWHPELAEAFRTTFIAERRAVMREVLERGVARGELSVDTDLELLGDVASALLWHRFSVTGAPLDDDLPRRIVDQFFGGAPPDHGQDDHGEHGRTATRRRSPKSQT